MAVPAFLASSYYYHHTVIADFSEILDEIVIALTGQTPAWTVVDNRPGTDSVLATSPVDADGRFFDISFEPVAASSNLKMQYVLRNQTPVTLMTRRTNTTATNPWDIFIYSGQYHFAIDLFFHTTAPENMWACITDLTPEAQTQNDRYVYGNASRTSLDAPSSDTCQYAFGIDNITIQSATRCGMGNGPATTVTGLITESGYRRFISREFWARPLGEGTYQYFTGRGYQQVLVHYSATAAGKVPVRAEITVPIDTGSTGVFKVFSLGTSNNRVLAWRIA